MSRLAIVFDFGERRIGLAVANELTSTATELGILSARDGVPDWNQVAALIADWRPHTLVVGLPYNMDGSESTITARARRFAAELRERYGLPTDTMDERLTSVEANALLREQRRQGLRKRRLRRPDIDSMAARLIAESWIAREHGGAEE